MPADDLKLLIHTANIPDSAKAAPERRHARPRSAARPRRLRVKTRLSFQERLLRNSFLACAVLLGILALSNVQQPWAQKASAGIERALTMEIDLDESLGQLSFVRNLVPESALVFFNLSGGDEFARPVQGELTHVYSADQPWLIFETEPDSAVCAVQDGTVSAVSPLSDGTFGVLIDHGEGQESVCACLAAVSVEAGDSVLRGAQIGVSGRSVYFEFRRSGQPEDPGERLGL